MLKVIDQLRRELQDLPVAGETLVVGFSGGRDSMALLHGLLALREQLGFTLAALHVNHHLHAQADAWQQFCEDVCRAHGIALQLEHLQLQRAAGDSLEALARAGRYQAFARAAGRYVLLAHHQDDQAETLLLQAMRGAGVAGLAAMPARRELAGRLLLRPLLSLSRQQLDEAVRQAGLSWVDDDSNEDVRYRRNAVRHQLVPVMQSIVPGVRAALARSAAHCGEAAELLAQLAALDADVQAATLPVAVLASLPDARARNVLRHWLHEREVPLPATAALNSFMQQVLNAAADRQPQLPLPGGRLLRWSGQLYWVPHWQPQPLQLHWQGETSVRLPGWGGQLHFLAADHGLRRERLLQSPLQVAIRHGGETLKLAPARPAQRVKHLFQDSAIPPWERLRWPLIWQHGDLLAVPGLGQNHTFSDSPGIQLHWQPD